MCMKRSFKKNNFLMLPDEKKISESAKNYAEASTAFTEMYVLSPLVFLNSTTPSTVAKIVQSLPTATFFPG